METYFLKQQNVSPVIITNMHLFEKIFQEEAKFFFNERQQTILISVLNDISPYSILHITTRNFINNLTQRYERELNLEDSSDETKKYILIFLCCLILSIIFIVPKETIYKRFNDIISKVSWNYFLKMKKTNMILWSLLGASIMCSIYIYRLYFKYKQVSKIITSLTFLDVVKKAAFKIGINFITGAVIALIIYFIMNYNYNNKI